MQPNEIVGYIGAWLTGLLLGLLGGGGSLLTVPVLVYIFHIPPTVATGYALFLVAVTSAFGAAQNIRQKWVDYNAVLYYGIPSMISIYIVRRFIIPALPDIIFRSGNFTLDKNHLTLFALVAAMLFAAYKMITDNESKAASLTHKKSHLLLIGYAVLLGAFLGWVGVGGGFLMVPALIYFAGLPPKKAIGTSLVLIAANSTVGFLGDIHPASTMDWKLLLTLTVFSIAGVTAGHFVAKYIESNRLKHYFGWFVVLVAVFIIVKESMLK